MKNATVKSSENVPEPFLVFLVVYFSNFPNANTSQGFD